MHIAFEEETQAQWLHDLLAPHVEGVIVCIKALFRARGIPTPGTSVYQQSKREQWLARLEDRGARARAEALLAELDVLAELRPKPRRR